MIGKEGLFKVNRWPRRKRLRGIVRRANRILRNADRFDRILDAEDWFYFAHWHRDWVGIGNYSAKIRLTTLMAHLKIFHVLAKSAPAMGKPFQLWISLDQNDAGQDAVFLHTPNPHSHFPAAYEDSSWGIPELELLLNQFLPDFQFKAGRCESILVAFAVGLGVPLDSSAQDA